MRKKTILRAIAILTCLAVVSLTMPTIAAAKDRPQKNYFHDFFLKHLKIISSLFPFFNIDVDDNPVPKQKKISKTADNSSPLKKITGTLNSVKPPKTGDEND